MVDELQINTSKDNSKIVESRLNQLSPNILKILLQDKTTGRNIFWATDSYEKYGTDFSPNSPLRIDLINQFRLDIIKPRSKKNNVIQSERTRKKAEVFTPSWVCNLQNNLIDDAWFGRTAGFNTPNGKEWITITDPIQFPPEKTWQDYVTDLRLEVTSGEAPYLVSRYDTVTGAYIEVKDRIGFLDRKLRVISENVDEERLWVRWTFKAFKSCYCYEYQGDNLLLARENLLFTFIEHMFDKFGHYPSSNQLKRLANVIAWNAWQMDGLTNCVPYAKPKPEREQFALSLNFPDESDCIDLDGSDQVVVNDFNKDDPVYCLIADWSKMKGNKPQIIEFRSLLKG